MEEDLREQPEPEGEDDSMPGFFEEEEFELDNLEHDDGQSREGHDDTVLTPSKPHPKPRSGINAPSSLGTKSRDALQPSGSGLPGQDAELLEHTCPICGKQLKTDNRGLNAHIDFCLSKGAILEAQVEASSPKKLGQTPTVKRKP